MIHNQYVSQHGTIERAVVGDTEDKAKCVSQHCEDKQHNNEQRWGRKQPDLVRKKGFTCKAYN